MKLFIYILLFGSILCKPNNRSTTYIWNLPNGFYKPTELKNNLLSHEKVELGRFFFYDKRFERTTSYIDPMF